MFELYAAKRDGVLQLLVASQQNERTYTHTRNNFSLILDDVLPPT